MMQGFGMCAALGMHVGSQHNCEKLPVYLPLPCVTKSAIILVFGTEQGNRQRLQETMMDFILPLCLHQMI